jgi:hypothetical protein
MIGRVVLAVGLLAYAEATAQPMSFTCRGTEDLAARVFRTRKTSKPQSYSLVVDLEIGIVRMGNREMQIFDKSDAVIAAQARRSPRQPTARINRTTGQITYWHPPFRFDGICAQVKRLF